jgi:hypothetical protein
MMISTATGIPVEVMFAALGALVSALYVGILYEVRALRKGASKHNVLLALVCARLNIPFNNGDE